MHAHAGSAPPDELPRTPAGPPGHHDSLSRRAASLARRADLAAVPFLGLLLLVAVLAGTYSVLLQRSLNARVERLVRQSDAVVAMVQAVQEAQAAQRGVVDGVLAEAVHAARLFGAAGAAGQGTGEEQDGDATAADAVAEDDCCCYYYEEGVEQAAPSTSSSSEPNVSDVLQGGAQTAR